MLIPSEVVIVSPTPNNVKTSATAEATDTAQRNDNNNNNNNKDTIALGVRLGISLPSVIVALLSAWTGKAYRLKKANPSPANDDLPTGTSSQDTSQTPNGSTLPTNQPQAPPQNSAASPPKNVPPSEATTPQAAGMAVQAT
jgi:hypothetical protein